MKNSDTYWSGYKARRDTLCKRWCLQNKIKGAHFFLLKDSNTYPFSHSSVSYLLPKQDHLMGGLNWNMKFTKGCPFMEIRSKDSLRYTQKSSSLFLTQTPQDRLLKLPKCFHLWERRYMMETLEDVLEVRIRYPLHSHWKHFPHALVARLQIVLVDWAKGFRPAVIYALGRGTQHVSIYQSRGVIPIWSSYT